MPEVLYRVAREFDVIKVKPTKEGQERIDRLTPDRCCLGCERKVDEDERYTCGNCPTCYNAILELPKNERVALMKSGETLTPTGGGRKHKNDFTRRLAER